MVVLSIFIYLWWFCQYSWLARQFLFIYDCSVYDSLNIYGCSVNICLFMIVLFMVLSIFVVLSTFMAVLSIVLFFIVLCMILSIFMDIVSIVMVLSIFMRQKCFPFFFFFFFFFFLYLSSSRRCHVGSLFSNKRQKKIGS